ncbi:MAG: CoA pyrophosphatase [Spirochaetaceae bacterium]|nr:CoA pyrophosphatase [Spirochaetaceae bacterium]MCF7948200.1 CoA pyrophosphatase [Spirochaetia bacterium]MCF7950816.1 CoA pyrophosphatase [Spirochaetaceae bacterium]
MQFEKYCDTLRKYLTSETLPGLSVHMQLAPKGRIDAQYMHSPHNCRSAAVLILLYQSQSEIYLPLIRRTKNGTHGGQIALPGGAHEGAENFPIETALREAHEEIDIAPEEVNVLGVLTPLFIAVSNYSVTPVVACTHGTAAMQPQPSEVEEILPLPLKEILKIPEEGVFESISGKITAPYYRSSKGRIWGATAMLLSEFVYIHRRVEYRNKL